MKLVITGALGTIGARLIRSIPAGRYREVVLFDNLATQRYCSLFNLAETVPFRFVEGDICEADLEREFDGAAAVIHLAAITDAAEGSAIQMLERTNVLGSDRVARACLARKVPLLFPSTTSVYGSQSRFVDEDCPLEDLQPQSPYAATKLHTEQRLAEFARQDGLRFVTLRFGTVFGTSPGMRFHTAINKFIWQASTGQPVTVWQTALHQIRPYLHLEDAIRAIWFVLDRKNFDNRVYNVLTANASVNEILTILRSLVPSLQTTLVSSSIMNQLSFEVSTERFRSAGFTYCGSLEGGILETVEQFRALKIEADIIAARSNARRS